MTWTEWGEILKVLFLGIISYGVLHIAETLDEKLNGPVITHNEEDR